MYGNEELKSRSDYDKLENNWKDMAKVLNYCVGPTERRLNDMRPFHATASGSDLCRCGEYGYSSIGISYGKAGVTAEVE